MRSSSVSNLYAFCLNKRNCIFVGTGRPLLLILRFCGSIFGTARRSQKWDRENSFSFVLLLSCACGPKDGNARRSHFGTVFRFIFVTFFASRLKKRNVLVSTETLWLMATERQLGRPF